jgi:hypothetical protein
MKTLLRIEMHTKINMKGLITLIVIFIFGVSYSQNVPEKLTLRRSFIDSMDSQTREHEIIDTLTNYYSQFDYNQLNQAQKDLVIIKNVCDSLYELDLFKMNPNLVNVSAKSAFERIRYVPALSAIDDFQHSYQQLKPSIENGTLTKKLDLNSNEYDEGISDLIDQAVFSLKDVVCMLPRGKVLSMYYYIVDNKRFLYNEVDATNESKRRDRAFKKEKKKISKDIIGKWEITGIYDKSHNGATPIPESVLKNQLFSDVNYQLTLYSTGEFKINNGKQGKYLLGVSSSEGKRYIEILIDNIDYSLEFINQNEIKLKKYIYFNHQYEYAFKKIN